MLLVETLAKEFQQVPRTLVATPAFAPTLALAPTFALATMLALAPILTPARMETLPEGLAEKGPGWRVPPEIELVGLTGLRLLGLHRWQQLQDLGSQAFQHDSSDIVLLLPGQRCEGLQEARQHCAHSALHLFPLQHLAQRHRCLLELWEGGQGILQHLQQRTHMRLALHASIEVGLVACQMRR